MPKNDAPAHGSGVTPDGKTLWIASRDSNAVFAYSLPDLKLLGHVPTPELKVAGPSGVGRRSGGRINHELHLVRVPEPS